MAGNPFDAFDAPAPSAAPAGNPFDRFDGPPDGGSVPLRLRVGSTPAPRQSVGPASFDDRFGDGPMSAETNESSDPLGQGMRRVADERLVGKPSARNTAMAALYEAGSEAGLNLPGNIAAGIATIAGKTGSEGYSPSFSANRQLFDDQRAALARQSPKAALAGDVAGIVGGAVALPGLGGAAAATRVGRAGQAALTGGVYGTAAEAFDSGDLVQALIAGGKGALGGAITSPVIEKLAPHVVAGLQKATPVLQRLTGRGIPVAAPQGGFTPEAEGVLREIGIEPTALPADLALQMQMAFTRKGASPAVAREAAASEFGIPLSRGQASLDRGALDLEGAALSGARGGRALDIGRDFETRQSGAIDAARGRIQSMAARGGPVIDNPSTAFEGIADRARAAGGRYADDAARAAADRDVALLAIRDPGEPDVLQGATAAVEGVRDAARRVRDAYGAAYDDLDAIEGRFAPNAFARAGERIRGMLGPETPIAPSVTPAASQALDLIQAMPQQLGLRPGEGPTLQQVNLIRKGISRLYGATAQNGTDRAALGALREAFDRHVHDMADIGMFRPGPAPQNRGAAVGDDLFSRTAPPGIEAPPPDAIVVPPSRQGEPESLMRYLAKNGGIPLDAETRAADLHKTYVPGGGTMARRGAPTWDQIRVRLAENGFLPTDADGYASAAGVRDFVLDALHQERIGRTGRNRLEDETRGIGGREADRIASENADHASAIDREARRLVIDLEGFGVTGASVDRAALREAAEAKVLGHSDDAVHAYDQAVARRGAEAPDRGVLTTQQTLADAPFPTSIEGFGPVGDGFPAGDTGPADAMRKARGLFRDYKQAFSPRGPGDVAGQRLQRIVERDASPNEAVGMLFGTTTGRVAPGQLQTLARLREAVGADSEPWRAVQQSIIGRYVSGEPRDLGRRLDYLLRGEGRVLANSFLDDAQRSGLGQLRAAVAASERAQTAAPAWIQDVERGGFDPNRIASSLFGSGVPGARPGAVSEVKAAKGFLGETSAEWSALRQAAVQRITGSADQSMKAGKVVDQVRAFTDGPGAGVAKELFSTEEIGQLRRFAGALNATLRPDGSMKADAGGAARAAARALDVIAGAVAFKAGGPAAGIGAYSAKVGQRALIGGVGAARARRSFEGGAPRVRPQAPPLDLRRVGTGLALTGS